MFEYPLPRIWRRFAQGVLLDPSKVIDGFERCHHIDFRRLRLWRLVKLAATLFQSACVPLPRWASSRLSSSYPSIQLEEYDEQVSGQVMVFERQEVLMPHGGHTSGSSADTNKRQVAVKGAGVVSKYTHSMRSPASSREAEELDNACIETDTCISFSSRHRWKMPEEELEIGDPQPARCGA
ncbi:hypothetical protein BKA70DRAFT_1220726 [Coprinopsis sp. MPI-PUGE-AT-0042]|nr:hypothetical protein BKA70DRAFT_1220726 [Coprinopsis sp. MPI-PUGE-AT-0042]